MDFKRGKEKEPVDEEELLKLETISGYVAV